MRKMPEGEKIVPIVIEPPGEKTGKQVEGKKEPYTLWVGEQGGQQKEMFF